MLSKSKVIRGMQCPKSLWLYTHKYNLQDTVSSSQQAIFDTGHSVGTLAQRLWPDGIDACEEESYPNKAAAKRTQELLRNGQEIIYEATFIYDDTLVAVDILARENGQWNAYEIKSSTELKEVYYDDATVQYYVLKGAGIDLNTISIVHINNQYVRQGALDVNQLFTIQNITADVLQRLAPMKDTINDLHDLLKESMPVIDIGPHCGNPYACSFMGHCWKHVPEYSVFNIARIQGKAWDLYQQGILDITEVPDDFPLSEKQRLQVDIEKTKETVHDKKAIKQFVKDLNYPLYFLDYETIMPAVPMFDGLKPYQQMPFQYSLHVQPSQGLDDTHYHYLAPTNGSDPREDFIKQLINDCGNQGDIIVYNISFERGKTQALAEAFPKYAKKLLAICDRMKDLMLPFQQKHYYTADMRGSYSIKAVLPALVPELSYNDLEIADGGTASTLFHNYFVAEQTLPDDVRDNLLKYCEMDTWAMVKLVEVMRKPDKMNN